MVERPVYEGQITDKEYDIHQKEIDELVNKFSQNCSCVKK